MDLLKRPQPGRVVGTRDLRNAKAKGVHIGRKKTRPSARIRTLRRSGLFAQSGPKLLKWPVLIFFISRAGFAFRFSVC